MNRASRNLLATGLAVLGALLPLPASAQVTNDDVHAAERAAFGFGTLRGGANGNDPDAPNAANTDESKVSEYTVPPLFETPAQQTTEGWPARRAELAQMVEDVWVGRIPATVNEFHVVWSKETIPSNPNRGVVQHWIGQLIAPDGRTGPTIDATVSFPVTWSAEIQSPALIDYTYVWPPEFNFSSLNDEDGDTPRPFDGSRFAYDHGWVHVAYHPQLLQADNGAEMQQGVIGLARWPRQQHDWGALRAWAWGASKLREELARNPTINGNRISLTGHSRFGKGVLVAAAFDHEFLDAHVSSSGAGGASLMRRNFGELWENLTASGEFHWFTPNAMNFSRDPLTVNDLTVDAHTLIALRAPRPLFITTGLAEKGDSWVDPVGNWTSFMLAQPAWELFGASTPPATMPVAESREQLAYPLAWYQHGEGHVPWPAYDEFYEHAERYFED